MKLRRLTHLGALASAAVLLLSAVSAVSAASVAPIFHDGNVGADDCPAGKGVKIDGADTSGTVAGVTVTVTYHQDNSIDFAATGGTVSKAFIKGGSAYNEYAYSPSVASDTNLVSPLNGGENVPAVSHTVFCVAPTPEEEHHPDIHVEKTPSVTTLPAGGGSVTYTYVVTNTGDVPLSNVSVSDNKCAPVTFVSGDTDDDDKLDLAESWTFTCTTNITETTTNTAVATGHDGDTTVTDDDDATVTVTPPSEKTPSIHIEKTVAPLTLPAGGGDVTYTYVVTNDGDVDLINVTVTDDNGTAGSTDDDFTVDCPKTALVVDESMTCTADVEGTNATTTNIATARGETANQDEVSDTDDATVTVGSEGGVQGETDVPEAPSTDVTNSSGDAGSSLPILLIVLGIIGLAAVALTPARARRR